MTHVDVNGVCFNVERAGAGPALVLLHGFTGSSTTWADHVPVFAREFDTVAVDLLGHGASAVPIDPERYRMEHAVADLTGLLDQMNISQAAWLGYSMGGRVALQYAVAQPARVAALVLEGASPGSPIQPSGRHAFAATKRWPISSSGKGWQRSWTTGSACRFSLPRRGCQPRRGIPCTGNAWRTTRSAWPTHSAGSDRALRNPSMTDSATWRRPLSSSSARRMRSSGIWRPRWLRRCRGLGRGRCRVRSRSAPGAAT